MKKLHLTLALLFIIFSSTAFAIDFEWARYYNGGGADRGLHASTDNSGNAYLAGVSDLLGGSKLVLSSYTPAGVLIRRDVGNTFLSNADVKQIERDKQHNTYVLCQNAASSFTLIKYDHQAQEKWRNNYANYVVGFEIGDKGIYVNYLTPAGATIRQLKKNNGSTHWTTSIADPIVNTNTFLSDFTIDENDNTYFGGTTESGITADDYRLLKVNKNGSIIYNIQYSSPGSDDDEVFKIKANNAGELFVVGDYDNSILSRTYLHMVKFNAAGTFQWATFYRHSGPNNVFFPNNIEIGPDGNPVTMGTDNDFYNINPAGEVRRILVSKFNAVTGAIIYNVFPNDPDNDETGMRETGVSMTVDHNNNVFFGGQSNIYAGVGVDPNRWMIAKINTAGLLQWVDASTGFNDPSNQVNDITVTNDDFVYMAVAENFGASVDMGLIKYCQTGCFIRKAAPELLTTNTISVYPNPSSGEFRLQTSSTFEEHTQLSVFDINGKLIESISVTANDFQFGMNYAPGIYFVRLLQSGESKMIKIVKSGR